MSDRARNGMDFEKLAGSTDRIRSETPSRLKSRIYSALVRLQEESGPLMSLQETRDEGSRLCVFEELVRITPVIRKAGQFNYCHVCHARVLAEAVEDAPIYWGGCPYVGFQKR